MDLDRLFDIFDGKGVPGKGPNDKGLDYRKILESGVELNIVVSDLDEKQGQITERIVNNFSSPEELRKYMYASCLIPGVAGRPEPDPRNGHHLIDAKASRLNVAQQALDDGYGRVLVLTCRPEGSGLKKEGFVANLMEHITIGFSRLVVRSWREGTQLVRSQKQNLQKNHDELVVVEKNSKVVMVGLPAGYDRLSSSCTDSEKLRQAAIAAYNNFMNRFSRAAEEKPSIPARWLLENAPLSP